MGDTELTEYAQNADGTRTWTYSFEVQANGEYTYDIILKDSFGRTSETFTASIPEEYREEPAEPGTDVEEEEDGSAISSFFGKFKRFCQWLIDFFRSILALFR